MPTRKRTITLEQFYDRFLAFEGKINGQFRNVAIRFDQLEETVKKEIARLEVRMIAIERNLEKLTGDQERLQQEYFAIIQGLKRIESRLDTLTGQSKGLRSDLDALVKRVTRLEEQVFQAGEKE